MKSFTAFILCLSIALINLAQAGPIQKHHAALARLKAGGGAFTPDLFSEDCEGTGTPAGWTNTGSPNWDYTTSPGEGAQSLRCVGSSNTVYDFAGQTTVEAFCLFKAEVLPPSANSVFGFRDSASSALCLFRVNATGQIAVYANASDSAFSVDTVSTGTWYKGWLRFVSGGTCTAAFVAAGSGARPTSGNAFVSKTGGAGTVTKFNPTYGGGVNVLDTMMGSTTSIPDNP